MKSLLINNLDGGRVFTLSTFDTILGEWPISQRVGLNSREKDLDKLDKGLMVTPGSLIKSCAWNKVTLSFNTGWVITI